MKKKAPISKEKRDQMIKKALARFSTPEGQAELAAVFERAARNAQEYREKSRIDPASLKVPMGPTSRDGLWPHQR
jgi:hypothetical protein